MADESKETDASMAQLNLTSSGEQAKPTFPYKEMVLDPRGDLRLEVGPVPNIFVVDSRSLARVSPVWSAMLLGGWSESRPDNGKVWVVQLPDDDAHAIDILLGIIHGNFPLEPYEIPPDRLLSLTAAADKYDTIHLLRPWAPSWIKYLKQDKINHLTFQTCITYMCIAWNLGDQALFESLVVRVLLEAKVDNKGTLLDPSGNALMEKSMLTHMNIIGPLLRRRSELVEEVLIYIKNAVYFYLVDTPIADGHGCVNSGTGTCADKIESDCHLVLLGSLMRELEYESLFPLPESNDIFESVKSLEARITLLLTKVKPLGTNSRHEKCNQFPEVANDIRDSVLRKQHATILTSSHTKRMAANAEKSGCYGATRYVYHFSKAKYKQAPPE